MPAFIGLDLAWTAHHDTGVCVLELEGEGGNARCTALEARIDTPQGFARLLAGYRDVVVAVDAPLIVTQQRTAERELARRYAKYRASPHASNLPLLERTGRTAGPQLAAELARARFSLDPGSLLPRAAGRHALETYPHAGHVAMFGLRERIPYKRRKGRDTAFVRAQLGVYQRHLRSLFDGFVPGLSAEPLVMEVLDPGAPARLRGVALKSLEDRLDALFCAYVAWHAWSFGNERLEIFGNARDGHIAIPRPVVTSCRERSSP